MTATYIWFSWSNTCFKGEKVTCHACDTHTDTRTHGHVKVEQYSAEAESAIKVQKPICYFRDNYGVSISCFWFKSSTLQEGLFPSSEL